MLLFLAACGLISRPTPTAPPTDMQPLPIDWGTGPADMFLALTKQPPDGATEAFAWWQQEEAKGATDRLGPPIGIATLLREDYAVWNVVEIDSNELRPGGGLPPMALQAGRIPDDEKRGLLVATLYEGLLERIENSKEFAHRVGEDLPAWRIGLRLTPDVPWSTVHEVTYTAGQSQYAHYCFVGSGTFEALQQRCFELEPIPWPGRPAPPPPVEVVVRPGSAWRVRPTEEERIELGGTAFDDAPPVVLLRVEDPSIPAGDVATWIGELGRAGVGRTQVRISGSD